MTATPNWRRRPLMFFSKVHLSKRGQKLSMLIAPVVSVNVGFSLTTKPCGYWNFTFVRIHPSNSQQPAHCRFSRSRSVCRRHLWSTLRQEVPLQSFHYQFFKLKRNLRKNLTPHWSTYVGIPSNCTMFPHGRLWRPVPIVAAESATVNREHLFRDSSGHAEPIP